MPHDLDDAALLRYSRHLLLDELGLEGQQRLAGARVLLIGLGGLGCPAAAHLVAAGIGALHLVDPDTVELGNLQRQLLHATSRIGMSKVASAALALRDINEATLLHPLQARADRALLDALVPGCSVVLDGSDNLQTRHAVNEACVRHGVPLVSGAASAWSGQLAVFDRRDAGSPCYACLFPPGQGEDEPCAITGVFAPLTGAIGAWMAGEALRLIAHGSCATAGHVLALDARSLQTSRFAIARDPVCPVCASARTGGSVR